MKKPAEMEIKTDLCSRNEDETNSAFIAAYARYGPCRKNQAVAVGGYALDGCQEFLAAGAVGMAEAFTCAACGCNRSFHRRDVQMEFVSECSTVLHN